MDFIRHIIPASVWWSKRQYQSALHPQHSP